MNRILKISTLLILMASTLCCHQLPADIRKLNAGASSWKQEVDKTLPLLGHRNWIIVVDKAFPLQNSAGMQIINTNELLLPVLKYLIQQTNAATHIKPIIYGDKELSFITEQQAPGVTQFLIDRQQLFNGQLVQTILHDSVFAKLDDAAKLFKVIVLKTNETIPYTSVFLQLDCAYWSADKEKQLRSKMEGSPN